MKLLVSDFDGTMYNYLSKNHSIKLNVEAIKEFQKKGNKFMLSTGRNYPAIKPVLDKYQIPYDFLSCSDGSILFDSVGNILNAYYFTYEEAYEIVKSINEQVVGEMYELYGVLGQTKLLDHVLELVIISKVLKTKEVREKLKKILSDFPDIDLTSFPAIHFIKHAHGKSRTIHHILENMPEITETYTIGDNLNDIEMLTDFNGSRVFPCHPALLKSDISFSPSVRSLIKKIK